ncbi:hypothetical protein [Kinneretia aquatilis]|uniref:hypothetical protein n=1 Tax=Kinneretia aquatilis TaxID=2070761 RepID=UPI0014950A8A|nr:hypothetical protein [Paucibacter aquatile]WIV99066.1 hypothetical protein K9V56_006150 [Paucibacter aquatile]
MSLESQTLQVQGRMKQRLLGLLLLGSSAWTAAAGALSPQELPPALRDWLPWALQGQESQLCPLQPGRPGEAELRNCLWPARLELRAGPSGASFRLEVQVYGAASLLPLPGEAADDAPGSGNSKPSLWPQDVKSAGKPLAVVLAQGRPSVRLEPGRHVIEGQIPWAQMPQGLLLPPNLGLLNFWLEGQAQKRTPDALGRLWLKASREDSASSEALSVRTARLIDDQVPMRINTHIELAVSGRARELVLPQALLPGLVAEALSSALPARLREDGALLVQARPGRWTVELLARGMAPTQALQLPASTPKPGESPLGEEVWAFSAHNELRVVSIEGAPAVDPKQTVMPESWQSFPTYRMAPGATLQIKQSRRGNPEPAPDQLRLKRQLWLDFDGQGYTAQDRIEGELSRSTRLELATPGALGRAELDGQDQLITRRGPSAAASTPAQPNAPDGIEVRQGTANITAESRWTRDATLPASGWSGDFQSARSALHLPPGWRLLHASGPDRVAGSWLGAWSLWDFFFVLLSALAAGRLLGWPRGLLLGAALVCSWHLRDAPQFLWLFWLGLMAVNKALGSMTEKFARLALLLRRAEQACMVAIALLLLPFGVDQLRYAMYPALDQPAMTHGLPQAETAVPAAAPPFIPPPEMAEPAPAGSSYSRLKEAVSDAAPVPQKEPRRLDQADPSARVQTGPGLPSWHWQEHALVWQGPVQADQALQLYLLPPAGTALLRVASLLLMLAALLALASGRTGQPWWPRRAGTGAGTSAALTLTLALGLSLPADPAHAENEPAKPAPAEKTQKSGGLQPPSDALLAEMRQRLRPAPDCLPRCAELARLNLQAEGSRVLLRLEAHAQADVALPLPGQAGAWQPSQVLLDGQPAPLRRDAQGQLWIALKAGISQISMEADLGATPVQELDISLPLPVRELKSQLRGWRLQGLNAQGLPGAALSLLREQSAGEDKAASGAEAQNNPRDALPAFVRIQRQLELGLRWTVHTRIERIAPSRAPLRVQWQLLPGEAVQDNSVQISEGLASVQLGAAEVLEFDSELRPQAQLTLKSHPATQQIEQWTLDASTLWHVEHQGLAPVVHQQGGRWQPLWRPWPGEQLTLNLSRPAGVAGPTLTWDQVLTEVTPGARSSDFKLSATLRSSLGGQQTLQLPAGAALQGLSLDGAELPLQAKNGALQLPITPGEHRLELRWRTDDGGMGWWFRSPSVQLGAAGVNDSLQIHVPGDRIVLALGGPLLGPAVLFWGALLAVAILALGLSRVPGLPLKLSAWLLLGLGLAPVTLSGLAWVVAGFLLLLLRKRHGPGLARAPFIGLQLLLGFWALGFVAVLLQALQVGLLGLPDLLITGHESHASLLRWYADRFSAGAGTAQAWVISAPLWLYRLAMLLWALWLAASLLRWLKWGWECFSEGGLWREAPPKARSPQPPVNSSAGN